MTLTFIRIVLKILYYWYWWIPIQLSILAFVSYFGLMFLIYGTLTDIKEVLSENNLSSFWCFFVPFGVPTFLSLGATISGSTNSGAIQRYRDNSLD